MPHRQRRHRALAIERRDAQPGHRRRQARDNGVELSNPQAIDQPQRRSGLEVDLKVRHRRGELTQSAGDDPG